MGCDLQFDTNLLEAGRANVTTFGCLGQFLIGQLGNDFNVGGFIIEHQDSRIGQKSGTDFILLGGDHGVNIDTFVENVEAIFESRWEKAETKALRKGDDCPTASMEYIDDIIVLAVEDMVQQISDGIDLEDKVGRRLGARLLRAMQRSCDRSFKNKADERFQRRWNQAIAWAEKKGLPYYGPPNSDIEDIIDALVTDVLAGIQ